ncbi:MAG: NAD-dependent epimerase/dehydratase family protein [Porticoccaceae bacterium]
MLRVLITGASGFVAEHLIPILRFRKMFVVGLDRKKNPSAYCDDFICEDLNNLKACQLNKYKFDLVIHLAAARADWGVSDQEFFRDNVNASQSLINAIGDEVPKIVFVSSISVMPQETSDCLDESAPYDPINAYGFSKKDAELLFIKKYKSSQKTDLAIIRPSVLYGPSNPENTGIYRAVDNNIFRLIDGISSRRFAIVGDGKTIKTTAYVKNFVDAIIFAVENAKGFELYVYADTPPSRMIDLVKDIRLQLGKSGIGLRLPFFIIRPISGFFDFLSKITKVNFPITKARIDTFVRPTNFNPKLFIQKGFKQKYSTKEALKESVEWYIDLKKKSKSNFFFFREDDQK